MNAQPERRIWLIDAAYMLNAQRSVGPAYQFDYLKLRNKLEERGKLVQAYYLNSTPDPPTDAQNGFHTWLKSGPPNGPKLQVRLYGLKTLRGDCQRCHSTYERQVQKGVDVGITTLALTLVDRYDTLILSSGDGDFIDALEYVRNTRDKRVDLVVFKSGVSTDLQSISDEIMWIDDFKDEVARTSAAATP